MTVELRPLGVTCNLACHYCYQNPQREAGNARPAYDLEKIKQAAMRMGGPFTLFGGEPLMIGLSDLEHLFAWGLETHGQNAIQTNGLLIETAHIELFRRYKVSVGISIDGPGALNDARWHRSLDKTRRSTARVQEVIARLCREHEPPGLIVTLHKGNATRDRLAELCAWLRELDALAIKSVRLHLLEVDHPAIRDRLALSARENIEALCTLADLEQDLSSIRFDLFREMEQLLAGRDGAASCTWRACDPYTTDAVQGVEGDGQTSNCGRTNKDGIGFIKSELAGYERYLALYRTPQSQNGCAGCRFFLMCKGQCPGTAIDGDWRNRTEHCAEWMHLFATIERRMILAGAIPLTIQPLRLDIEQRQLAHWACGENPSMSRIAANLRDERAGVAVDRFRDGRPAEPKPRLSWVSDAARDIWQPRIARIRSMLEDITAHEVLELPACCAACATAPGAVAPSVSATARLISAMAPGDGTELIVPESSLAHPLLSPLGLSLLPVLPCRPDCAQAAQYAERRLERAAAHGYGAEAEWLRTCLSWAMVWSDLHGVVEIKTPVFKLALLTGSQVDSRQIRKLGSNRVEGAIPGLDFPFLAPSRRDRGARLAS
jgi:uncharacterized protein